MCLTLQPHRHNCKDPDLGVACRNPVIRNKKQCTKSKPWCFTMAMTVRWAYCDIPMCKGEPHLLTRNEYIWIFQGWCYISMKCACNMTEFKWFIIFIRVNIGLEDSQTMKIHVNVIDETRNYAAFVVFWNTTRTGRCVYHVVLARDGKPKITMW